MQSIKDEYEAKGISIITVSTDRGDDLKRYWDENDLDLKVLADVNREIVLAYGVRSLPASFFIDTDGTVLESKEGWGGNDLEEWKDKVEKYLAR